VALLIVPRSKASNTQPPHRAAHLRWYVQNGIVPLLVIFLLLSRGNCSVPQTLSEYQIKAGYLFNFTRFVEWPEKAFATTTSPIMICIVGNTPLTNTLSDTVVGKVVNGRAVSIKPVKATDELRGCNLVFVSAAQVGGIERILRRAKDMSVLSVGEAPNFAQSGGMINFFVQDNKVKLELNLDAAARANLKISAKLIAVSRLVSTRSVIGDN
jgi:hypothetical protein